MGNVIKMDFKRMVKSKFTWVILVSFFALLCFMVAMISDEYRWFEKAQAEMTPEQIENYQRQEESYGEENVGMSLTGVDDMFEGDKMSLMVMVQQMLSSKIILIFLTIFTVLLVNGEQKTGFIKNIAGQVRNRGQLVFSKFLLSMLYIVAMLVLMVAACAISGVIFYGAVNFAMTGSFLLFLLYQFLLHTAFVAIIVACTVLLNNSAGSIAVGILISLGVTSYLYGFIDTMIRKVNPESTLVMMDYVPTGNISGLVIGAQGGDVTRALVVAAVFIVGCVVLGMGVMKKRDVR